MKSIESVILEKLDDLCTRLTKIEQNYERKENTRREIIAYCIAGITAMTSLVIHFA